MRRSLALFVFVICTAPALAQVNFDAGATCAAFPSPIGAGGDPEGVSWNGAGTVAGNLAVKASGANGGFPVFGPQYAEVRSNGPGGGFNPGVAGPIPRPLAGGVNELAIPVPTGTTYVSFSWDWHNADAGFNDGTSIDIVNAAGQLLAPLAYAHDGVALAGATGASCAGFVGTPTAPAGPNYTAKHFPATPAGAYLSVAAWNGQDNAFASHVRIDNIRFGNTRSAVTFERPGADCTWAFPACGAAGDPENVGWNGAGGASVSGVAGCGFPIGGGGQSLRVQSNGPLSPPNPLSPPAGGPIIRPILAPVTEVCVPLPAGSTDISFCWDFYSFKSSSGFNDGLSIDIVTAGGATIVPLVYADTFTPAGPCAWGGACGEAGDERAPAGPQYFRGNFAPLPGGAYLSIACWNGGDNVAASSAAVDNIATGGPQLDYNSAGGGTLALQNLGWAPGDSYMLRATTDPAFFPNGWFFGINLSLGEFFSETGPPWDGVLNGCGSSGIFLTGVPPGIPVFGVTLSFNAGNLREASAPYAFTTQ